MKDSTFNVAPKLKYKETYLSLQNGGSFHRFETRLAVFSRTVMLLILLQKFLNFRPSFLNKALNVITDSYAVLPFGAGYVGQTLYGRHGALSVVLTQFSLQKTEVMVDLVEITMRSWLCAIGNNKK
jgi:hypothetical protein